MEGFTNWLEEQDVSIQYLYSQLILEKEDRKKQELIPSKGYGSILLSKQNPDGHWGKYYYQPKWTSTHYTLLQLKELGISKDNPTCQKMVAKMFSECQLENGGLNLAKSSLPSDVCVDGMILNYSSYFIPESAGLELLTNSIIAKQKRDGGFTWYDQDYGDPHSSICVLEGLISYQENVINTDMKPIIEAAITGILNYFTENNLFLSQKKYQNFVYPFRYFYSVFRFLLVTSKIEMPINDSIRQALEWLVAKEPSQFIKLEKTYPGREFITFSKVGEVNPFLTVYGAYIRNQYSYYNI
ncbi:hypothetical protein [Enterococcus gilvus]|uniref:hypothetical protein n=1 Tax=Enterococcus gilvus TaxID=160453 RepID=UPI0028D76DB1|nr:hypothetical protein [Enterococcus gilvus]